MKYWWVDKYQWQPIIKITTNNNNISKSNLATKYKEKPQSNQWINKIKRVEKTEQHQRILYLSSIQQWPTMRRNISNSLSMSFFYKEIQNGYKKLASTSSSRTYLISTIFSVSSMKNRLNDFTYQKCLQMTLHPCVFLPNEPLPKRHRPISKSPLF